MIEVADFLILVGCCSAPKKFFRHLLSNIFFNVANCGDLCEEVNKILPLLPEPLRENLKKGYDAFSAQEDICDYENEELFEECDDFFYENEQLLLDILKVYADSLTL